ncbi:MAG: acyl-[Clostridia bacterium]|nr:acyl-[acyl-carrier-protein] thioesterase [Clostridia bacterium]
MKWTEPIKVNSHDTDYNGVLRASGVLKYMQEAANMQLHELGPSNDELMEQGQTFFLSRIGFLTYEPIAAYEELRAQSWAGKSRGFSFNRFYRIYRGDIVVAEGVSVWALLDMNTHHPLRVDSYHANFEIDETLALDLPAHFRMPKPTEEMERVGSYTVLYDDLDKNMHMNNTRYPDMLLSTQDMRGKYAQSLVINYVNEAPLGEVLSIYSCCDGDTLYLKSVRRDGKTNAEAQLKLKDL